MPRVSADYRDERRAEILRRARACFLVKGFHATSMQDVLAATGISSGAFYGYFASKDDLVMAIAEDNLSQVIERFTTLLSTGHDVPAGDALADALGVIREQHAQDGLAATAVQVWAEALGNARLRHRLAAALGSVEAQLRQALQSSGSADVEGLAGSLLALLPGYILQLAIRGDEATSSIPEGVRRLTPSPAVVEPRARAARSSRPRK